MKKLFISVILLLLTSSCYGQSGFSLGLRYDPHISWSSDDGSIVKYTNSKGLTVGYNWSARWGIESGVWLNQFGYRRKKTFDEIGVIDNLNSYILTGGIYVHQKFTEKFFELPLQINFRAINRKALNLSVYAKGGINFYRSVRQESWYYYQSTEEFSTDNTFIDAGAKKRIWRLEFGLASEKVLYGNLSFIGGINYSQLTHEYTFPQRARTRQFYNLGGILGLKYYLKRTE